MQRSYVLLVTIRSRMDRAWSKYAHMRILQKISFYGRQHLQNRIEQFFHRTLPLPTGHLKQHQLKCIICRGDDGRLLKLSRSMHGSLH